MLFRALRIQYTVADDRRQADSMLRGNVTLARSDVRGLPV